MWVGTKKEWLRYTWTFLAVAAVVYTDEIIKVELYPQLSNIKYLKYVGRCQLEFNQYSIIDD